MSGMPIGSMGSAPMSGAGPLGNTPQLGNGPPQMATATQGMPPQGMGGSPWSPAFSQQSTANPSNTNAIYPQLTGGNWNQMTQMLAGPQYQPKAPVAPTRTGISPGGVTGPSVGGAYSPFLAGGVFNGGYGSRR